MEVRGWKMEDKLKEDLKQAQLSRDKVRVSTLRLLLSEINNAKIAKRDELNDDELVGVVRREVKKRTEGADGFRSGGRKDAADREEAEAKILEAYLPAQMSDDQLQKLVEESINLLGANNISDTGRVIGMVMGKVAGKADGGRVSSLVKERLPKF